MTKDPGIRFTTFPLTAAPPRFVESIAKAFRSNESRIGTQRRTKGLTSDRVLAVLRPELEQLGFAVERGKRRADKIERPVFFGEDGTPTVRYEVDAFHEEWQCGLEIEAGRAWLGNAVYRDLVLASLMVDVNHFVLAVPNAYKYQTRGQPRTSSDYAKTTKLSQTIFGHRRLKLPYGLTVIGY